MDDLQISQPNIYITYCGGTFINVIHLVGYHLIEQLRLQ